MIWEMTFKIQSGDLLHLSDELLIVMNLSFLIACKSIQQETQNTQNH